MYTALAKVYDLFYGDDNADRAAYYSRFLPKGEGVDLGCGTGGFTLELDRLGYKLYGIDNSEDMLQAATEKAREAGTAVKFILGDASRPAAAHPLAFATAANDVFNYIGNLDAAFSNIYGILEDGGVLVFDISSEYKLTKILAGNTFSETEDDTTYIWRNYRQGKRLIIDFTVFSPLQGSVYAKTEETQTQYIRSQQEITDKLVGAGFGAVKAYCFGKTTKPTATTPRILFVAKKGKKINGEHT